MFFENLHVGECPRTFGTPFIYFSFEIVCQFIFISFEIDIKFFRVVIFGKHPFYILKGQKKRTKTYYYFTLFA